MAVRKKKSAGKKKSTNNQKKSNKATSKGATQGPVQLLAQHPAPGPASGSLSCTSLIKTSAPINITPCQEPRRAQVQCHLLQLPLEIRVMTYKLVLSTGTIDVTTSSSVLTIAERHGFRRRHHGKRQNGYRPMNFGSKHFAILKTCHQINNEVKAYFMSRLSFKFMSADALGKFVCGQAGVFANQHRITLLEKSTNIEVVLRAGTPWYFPMYPLRVIATHLKAPLDLNFSEYQPRETPSRVWKEATKRWAKIMDAHKRRAKVKGG